MRIKINQKHYKIMEGFSLDLIVVAVVNAVGVEKAREVKGQLLGMADKMKDEQIYMLKKIPNRGVCLLSTNTDDTKVQFSKENPPKVTDLEKLLSGIEVD